MSGYGVYEWRAAEEARQRELARLRGECAALRNRRAALAKAARKAARTGHTVAVPAELVVDQHDEEGMAAAVATMTAELDAADRELVAAWETAYRTRVSGSAQPQAQTTAAQEHAATRATRFTPADAAVNDHPTVLAELVRDGELLAHRAALRCEPAQLTDVRAQLDRLVAATTVPVAQACLIDLKVTTQRAVEQAKRAAVRAEALARLEALLAEVDAPRRAALRRYVDNVPDPAEPAVAMTVMAAIDRQNHARARVRLAGVLTEVLTELEFSLGAEFTTELAGQEAEAVAALPGNSHYGLRMSLDDEGRLRTELVRASTMPPETDLAAEIAACRGVVNVLAKAGDRGVDISRTGPAVFGSRPPVPVDPSLLARPGKRAVPRTKPHQQARPQQRGAEPGGSA